MNSFRCMKLKLSRRSDEDAENVTTKSDLNLSGRKETLVAHHGSAQNTLPSQLSSLFKQANFASAQRDPGLSMGLLSNETPPPSPSSCIDDHMDKTWCRIADKGSLDQNSIPRTFLSPTPTDEEDTDNAISATRLQGDAKEDCAEREKKVCGVDHPNNIDANRKGDIFKCSFCERTFSYLCHMKVHERVHTGEKPYSCKFCNTQFSQLGSLTVHMRIHTGEKPYQCSQCSKRFRHINSLRRHQRQVHTGSKPLSQSAEQQTPNSDNKAFSPRRRSNVVFNPFMPRGRIPYYHVDPHQHDSQANKSLPVCAGNKRDFSGFRVAHDVKLPTEKVSSLTDTNENAQKKKKTSIFKSIEHLLGLNEKNSAPQASAREGQFAPAQAFQFNQPWGLLASPAKRIKSDARFPSKDGANTDVSSVKLKKVLHSDDGYSEEDLNQIDSGGIPNMFNPVRHELALANLAVQQRMMSAIARTNDKYHGFIALRKWSEDSGIAVGHETNITANA